MRLSYFPFEHEPGVPGVLGLVLMIWALIDCAGRRFSDPTAKLIWVLLIVFLPVLGPILYFLFGKKQGEK